LPPAPEGRQVVGLALLGLERDDDLRGWLQWLVLNGHWAVLAEVLPPLVRRLEGAQPGVPAGHGRLREPVLQHLRRVLLLTSVDAGTASLPQLQASGLLGLLDAEPAVAMPEPLRAQWRALRAGAFQGEGVRLRHRLQAGLMLGWLGDNIRYEFVQRARPNGGLVRGLRPKPALWAEVGVPGRKTVFPIGSPRGVGWPDERPAWTAELEHFRLCRLPLTVGEWRCFMEGGAKARHESGTARLAGWNNPLQPVTGITWRGAVAYAAWAQALYEPERAANGRVLQLGLPSEVQWEAAVRGPRNAVDTSAAAQERSALEVNHNDTRWVKPSPVSVFSACPSPLGLFDALGNVWEWCSNGDTATRAGPRASAHWPRLLPATTHRCEPCAAARAAAPRIAAAPPAATTAAPTTTSTASVSVWCGRGRPILEPWTPGPGRAPAPFEAAAAVGGHRPRAARPKFSFTAATHEGGGPHRSHGPGCGPKGDAPPASRPEGRSQRRDHWRAIPAPAARGRHRDDAALPHLPVPGMWRPRPHQTDTDVVVVVVGVVVVAAGGAAVIRGVVVRAAAQGCRQASQATQPTARSRA
ncbi:MAG: formylglycine-generating enzyme family protein, partial [Hydrogenophaga sp.]|nr:formylglycine-generating enzyme family protein [Hydrogenophaga sp.]